MRAQTEASIAAQEQLRRQLIAWGTEAYSAPEQTSPVPPPFTAG